MTVETIPLSKLSAWKGNVRKTAVTDGLDELKASIAAQGVLVPLLVQKGDKGERRVIAGQRRLAALRALQKEGTIPVDHPVPCMIVAAEADATEISLTENVVRSQMHPADQFEAFRDLIDKGSSIGDVAARFGVSETSVTKLMKLGRVSPKLLDQYRKGEMDMAEVQAFTLTDDHAVQEAYWKDAKGWQRQAHYIREALTKGDLKATDRRVIFIGGVEKYEAAGGTVRRDLFDEQNAGYISDLTLLNQLVTNRLETIAAAVRAEGWKWVEIMPDVDWNVLREFEQVYPEKAELTPEQQQQLSGLAERYDEIAAAAEEEELTDEVQQEFDEVEAAIAALQSRERVYRSEDIAKAGAFVSVGYRGEPEIRRGWVKPEDQEQNAQTEQESADAKPATEESGVPASLIEDLTAQRTAAMRVEMAKRPSLALATVVYTLAASTRRMGSTGSCLKMSVQQIWLDPMIKHAEESVAFKEYTAEKPILAELPDDEAALWQFCLEQSDAKLMELFAVLVAPGIDAVDYKSGSKACPHAHRLADALGLDMTKHFKATAETCFSRLPKVEIVKTLAEMDGGEPVSAATLKLKKGALAELAERTYEATGRKWLPEVLRSEQVSGGRDEAHANDEDIEDAA